MKVEASNNPEVVMSGYTARLARELRAEAIRCEDQLRALERALEALNGTDEPVAAPPKPRRKQRRKATTDSG